MFVIEVTYGNRPRSVYATSARRDWAEALREAAVKGGYTDAKVVPEKEFKAKLAAGRGVS